MNISIFHSTSGTMVALHLESWRMMGDSIVLTCRSQGRHVDFGWVFGGPDLNVELVVNDPVFWSIGGRLQDISAVWSSRNGVLVEVTLASDKGFWELINLFPTEPSEPAKPFAGVLCSGCGGLMVKREDGTVACKGSGSITRAWEVYAYYLVKLIPAVLCSSCQRVMKNVKRRTTGTPGSDSC